MKKSVKIGILLCIAILLILIALKAVNRHEQGNTNAPLQVDGFSQGLLDPNVWQITRAGDFRKSKIDVIELDPQKKLGFRLRLRADTIGTDDSTVKFHGVRSVRQINFSDGAVITVDLDWNNQTNGSYLTAAVYFCPTLTEGNPREEPDWLRLEYVGVPPGKNARATVASSVQGRIRWLYTEGWPDKQRTGRKIGLQHLAFLIDPQRLTILENDRELFRTDVHRLSFTQGYLYLQMSSHSNYPAREIYFGNITIHQGLGPKFKS